jgi:hypothetical protein
MLRSRYAKEMEEQRRKDEEARLENEQKAAEKAAKTKTDQQAEVKRLASPHQLGRPGKNLLTILLVKLCSCIQSLLVGLHQLNTIKITDRESRLLQFQLFKSAFKAAEILPLFIPYQGNSPILSK